MMVRDLVTGEEVPRLIMDETGWGRALPRGTVTILTGVPGSGKSTFLLKSLGTMEGTILYIGSEESSHVISDRCVRVSGREDMYVYHCTSIFETLAWANKLDPDILVLDSLNGCTGVESHGENANLSDKLKSLSEFCLAHGTTAIVISHINKDNQVFGPRTLEHMSDINMVIEKIEGGELDEVRVIRATKNRFGPTGRYAAFRHAESGLVWTSDDEESLTAQREKKAKRVDKMSEVE